MSNFQDGLLLNCQGSFNIYLGLHHFLLHQTPGRPYYHVADLFHESILFCCIVELPKSYVRWSYKATSINSVLIYITLFQRKQGGMGWCLRLGRHGDRRVTSKRPWKQRLAGACVVCIFASLSRVITLLVCGLIVLLPLLLLFRLQLV